MLFNVIVREQTRYYTITVLEKLYIRVKSDNMYNTKSNVIIAAALIRYIVCDQGVISSPQVSVFVCFLGSVHGGPGAEAAASQAELRSLQPASSGPPGTSPR